MRLSRSDRARIAEQRAVHTEAQLDVQAAMIAALRVEVEELRLENARLREVAARGGIALVQQWMARAIVHRRQVAAAPTITVKEPSP